MRPSLVLLVALCLAAAVVPGCWAGKDGEVRRAAVAGQFYPGDPAGLKSAVADFLAGAVPARGERPLALVVPHAGYVFSGQIAADGFRQAAGFKYGLVVILGTNHTAPPFKGAAVYPGRAWQTPLGAVNVDRAAAEALVKADKLFRLDARPHEKEHSIEVEVPFVQDILPGIPILPMVVGSNDRETALRMGEILAGVLGKQKPLIVASSDLSHYPSERLADDADRKTLAAVASLDAATAALSMRRTLGEHSGDLATCACGEGPILTAMAAARRLGARRGIVLSYANSGDTVFGEPGRVVGYGAVAFTAGSGGTDQAALETAKGKDELTVSDKAYLLKLARRTLQEYFSTGMVPLPRQTSAALASKRGAFVTLTENGDLRGCIGYMAEDTPLALVVARTTLDSALKDSRFRPVEAREVTALKIKISALTPRRRVSGPGTIVVGRDGVVLESRGRRAVFLPEVAVEQGWDRSTMLDYLCRKAGLPEGCWKHGATFHTFQTTAFGEEDAP